MHRNYTAEIFPACRNNQLDRSGAGRIGGVDRRSGEVDRRAGTSDRRVRTTGKNPRADDVVPVKSVRTSAPAVP